MDQFLRTSTRLVFAVFSIFISIGVVVIVSTTLETDAATDLIIGLLALVISFQVSEMASREIEKNKQDEFRNIENDDAVKALVLSIAASRNELTKNAKSKVFEECLREFFIGILETADADLKEISHARMMIEDTDLERVVTRNLLKIAEKEIRATSVYEETFWNDNDTSIYLDMQRELINERGVSIHRIFVFDVNNKPSQFPVEQIKKQIDSGIYVRVLWRNNPVEEDIIVYDKNFVRIGKNIRFGSALKHLECTANPGAVLRRLNEWDAYWEQSVPVSDTVDVEAAIERALAKCATP